MKKEIIIQVNPENGSTQMKIDGMSPYEAIGLLDYFRENIMDQLKAKATAMKLVPKIEEDKSGNNNLIN